MKSFRCKIFLFAMVFLGLIVAGGASATTYQEEVDVRFTFDQTLSVDLSSTNLAISSLAPGTTGTSSPIDVTVNTNNIGGYTLTASVGDASHNTTSLTREDGADAVFTNIARDANLTTLDTDNTWGYSVDAGEHFFGLPLYSDTESLVLKETDGAVEDNTVSFLIGAKAGISQPLGDYSNVVNFKAVAKVYNPMRTFQETEYTEYATLLPHVGDTMEIMDARDNEVYTIGRLADGNVWLLDNLRLNLLTVGTVTGEDTNLYSDSNHWNPSTHLSDRKFSAESKDVTMSYGSGSGKVGNYYNFCWASANSFCNPYNDTAYSADVCPKGWRLPTGGSDGEYQALYSAYNGNAADFKNALRTPLSGKYGHDSTAGQHLTSEQGTAGYFWSSTYYDSDSNNRYALNVSSSTINPQYALDISTGGSVRCILYNGTLRDQPTLQNVSNHWLAEYLRKADSHVSLSDERDGRFYTIRKLQDGNYWFVDDLKIGANGCWDTPDGNQCNDGLDHIYLGDGFMEKGGNSITDPYWTDHTLADGNSDITVLYNYCAMSKGSVCDEGVSPESITDFYYYAASPSSGRCSMFEEWYGGPCEYGGGEGGGEWGGEGGEGGYYDEWGNWIDGGGEGGGEWGGEGGGEWGSEGGEGDDCGYCETNWELQENYLDPGDDIIIAPMSEFGFDGGDSNICPTGWDIPTTEIYSNLYFSYASDSDYLSALHYTLPENGNNTFWTSDVLVYSLPNYGTFKNGYAPPGIEPVVYDSWGYLIGRALLSEAGVVDITSPSAEGGEYNALPADRSELHRVRCMR